MSRVGDILDESFDLSDQPSDKDRRIAKLEQDLEVANAYIIALENIIEKIQKNRQSNVG